MRRLWSEFVPYDVLRRPELHRRLASRGVGLLVAVAPHQHDTIGEVVLALRMAGVRVGLWPMLDDDQGRWLNVRNAPAFREHLLRTLTSIDRLGVQIDGVAFDLEPDIEELRGVLRGRRLPRPSRSAERERLKSTLASMIASVRSIESAALATIPPLFLWDGVGRGYERFFGLPLDAAFDEVNVMIYRSLAEGYAPFLGVPSVRRLVFELSRDVARRFGDRGSVSIGIAGRGALGDEQAYRSLAELSDDVSLVRAAGVSSLVLHDLAGVLARSDPDAWLDALHDTEPARALPRPRVRASIASVGARALGRLLAWPAIQRQ